MAKITQVTIKDATTLRLDVDAKQGDEINLLDIVRVDSSYINKIIDDKKEIELAKRLKEQKEILELETKNKINQETEKLKKENIELSSKINSLKAEIEASIKLQYLEEINKLKLEILSANNEKANIINNKQTEIEKELLKKDIEYKDILNKLKEEYNEKIREQEQKINDLNLQKSSLNVKRLGEELENWCNTEYENYAQCGFNTCTWEKDNISVKEEDESKGTKADYIFKVYANELINEKELLTSVACEMKNESPNSKTKKKNADHYNKLDKDRKKKNCEYALLISELEWDQPNDLPIKKVKEYEKMYVVRPQYFISFLSIVSSMSLKFKELLLERTKEIEKFKDTFAIKEEFEKFKNDLLDKPLAKLEKELNSIIKEANEIKASSDKIISFASTLISKTLVEMQNKINNFKIDRLVKKINKLEE